MITASSTAGACCLALASVLGGKTSFPNSLTYTSSLSSYFSQQESAILPRCIVSPETENDVAVAVKTLTSLYALSKGDDKKGCQFAIRSGGHTSWAGAANIDGGVTLDLRKLDSVLLDKGNSIVSVGAGTSWDRVYSKLDPLKLSVNGGRTAGVGVSGLSTRGGISYFSTRYGWTADTIVNYQIVLANGAIVNANMNENPDLLWALRGGSNNFGIVTRIDIRYFL